MAALAFFGFCWLFISRGKEDGGTPDAPPAQAAQAQGQRLQTEQVIKFPKPYFACVTAAKYGEAIEHTVKKEETKFEAMFHRFECFEIAPNVEFKILSIDSHYQYDIIELVPANSIKAEGLFTEWDYGK